MRDPSDWVGRIAHLEDSPRELMGLADGDDGVVQLLAAGGAAELGVAVVEDPAVTGHEPVALPGRGGPQADDGLGQAEGAGGAVEPGVAVVEDAPIPSHEPVALVGPGGHAADDRLVEADGAGGAVEGGIPEGKYAAVGAHEPVPAVAADRDDGDRVGAEVEGVLAQHGPGGGRR